MRQLCQSCVTRGCRWRRARVEGNNRGAKGAVTSVVRAIRDGDTIEVLSYFCRVADESIGGVLKGDDVLGWRPRRLGRGAGHGRRDDDAGTREARDVAGGGVSSGEARFVGGVRRRARRRVWGVPGLPRVCEQGYCGSGSAAGHGRVVGALLLLVWPMARGISAAASRRRRDARHGVGRASRRAGAAFDCLRSRAPSRQCGAGQRSEWSRRRRGGLRRRIRRHAARGPGRV